MNTIKCLHCFKLSETFIQLDLNPLESIISYVEDLEKLVEINEFKPYDHTICSVCERELDYEEYFIPSDKESLLTEAVSIMLGEEISRYIPYCSNCEIVKELEEVNNISANEVGRKLYSEGKNVHEFLKEHFVTSDCTSHIIPFLNCNCCGYGYNSDSKGWDKGSFDSRFAIYTENEVNSFLEIDMEEWSGFAEKYQIYIKRFELTNFLSFLKKSPMLALNHLVGKKLYELLSAMYKSMDYITLNNEILYRGRTRNMGSKVYKPQEMWNPPFGVSSHGRYNIVGTSVLYLTDNQNFIPYELHYTTSQELDVATIEVITPIKVLDLSYLIGDFGKFLSQNPQSGNIMKLEYLLTNFISECCKDIGFHGIKYKGVKEGDYNNYAILNYEAGKDLEIKKVETIKIGITYNL
ncbi:hypothetical protein [Priestia aryabhattai]